MKLQRNDPCYCGSNKKYKNCCWLKDQRNGIKKRIVNPIRAKAIEEIKRNPRGSYHWSFTNKVLDIILKEKLKDAPILKYTPEAWIRPLYTSYFILRSDYWRIIYGTLI